VTHSGATNDPTSETRTDVLSHLFERPAVRRSLITLAGLYLFLVCAAYFSRDIAKSDVSVSVFGPAVVAPSTVFPLRITSYDHHAGSRMQVDVSQVAMAGDSGVLLPFDKGPGSKPSYIHVQSPTESSQSARLLLTVVTSGDTTRNIEVPIQMDEAAVVHEPTRQPLTNTAPKGELLAIEVLPTGRGISTHLPSNMWLRVTEPDGSPVAGATIEWSAPRTTPAAGNARTNAAGLAMIQFSLRSLSTKLQVNAKNQGKEGRAETMLHGLGRACILRSNRVLQARNDPAIEVEIIRRDETDTIFCDLYRGNHWLRTWHLEPNTNDADGRVLVTIPMSDEGAHRFQCYSHFGTPGDGYAALWLLRSNQDRLAALQTRFNDHPSEPNSRDAVYHEALPDHDDVLSTVLHADIRTSAPIVTSPSLRTNTRTHDATNTDLANATAKIQFFLWIGASFGLVLLWAVYVGIQSSIQDRVRLADAIAELGDLAAPVPPTTALVRARTFIQMTVIVGILVLNVVAMLALFQYL